MRESRRIRFFAGVDSPKKLADLGGTFDKPEMNQSRGDHVCGSYDCCEHVREDEDRVARNGRRRRPGSPPVWERGRRSEIQMQVLGEGFASPDLDPEARLIAIENIDDSRLDLEEREERLISLSR